jgi:transcriptional antiterminator RfaH
MSWYCVKTKARQEKSAEFNLLSQGYTVFLPKCFNEKRKNKIEVMFPCYLFVSLTIGIDDFASIRSTAGCSEVVRFGNHIPTIDDAVIESLKGAADTDDVVRMNDDFFNVGDEVRIKSGTFKFFEGIIKARSGQDRVMIMMNVLGGGLVEVNINEVEDVE